MPTTKDHALLILDVDETLIHGTDPLANPPEPPPPRVDFVTCNRFQVMKRTHVDATMRWAFNSPLFRPAIWSNAGLGHIWGVLDHLLFPQEKERLAFVWDYRRCGMRVRMPGDWDDDDGERIDPAKNLGKVRRLGYDLNRVLVLDDNYRAWRTSYGNLIHIRPFTGKEDDELLRVQSFVERCFQDPRGVRRIEKRWWRSSL